MRKLLRNMARTRMKRLGYSKVNKRMGHGRWREIVNAYPINVATGMKMPKGYRGNKRSKAGTRSSLFAY